MVLDRELKTLMAQVPRSIAPLPVRSTKAFPASKAVAFAAATNTVALEEFWGRGEW